MVLCGADRLSREATVDKHDVRVTDADMATASGMRLSVDLFADPVNTRLQRFWSRDLAAGSEGVDALSSPTWGRQQCRTCEAQHDQALWVFAPVPLLPRVVGKLKADRAHGVALVPFRPDTVWWTVMQRASTEMVELTAEEAVDCSRIAGHAQMYTVSNWRLCTFNFDADMPR